MTDAKTEQQGLFVKYIQQETQTRVQIKGLGSGFIETETGREAEEPIHVHVTYVSYLVGDFECFRRLILIRLIIK